VNGQFSKTSLLKLWCERGILITVLGQRPFRSLSSACSVETLESTSTVIVAIHEQTSENSPGRNTVQNSPVTMQNFASHSQETVNFNAGAFSGANVTINF